MNFLTLVVRPLESTQISRSELAIYKLLTCLNRTTLEFLRITARLSPPC